MDAYLLDCDIISSNPTHLVIRHLDDDLEDTVTEVPRSVVLGGARESSERNVTLAVRADFARARGWK